MTVISLSDHFRQKRKAFADQCRERMKQAGVAYNDYSRLSDVERELITADVPAAEKLKSLEGLTATALYARDPGERAFVGALYAGVIVHERIRQSRAWLAAYERLGHRPGAEETATLPPLDLDAAMGTRDPGTILSVEHPAPVQRALAVTNTVFNILRDEDRKLKTDAPKRAFVAGTADPHPKAM